MVTSKIRRERLFPILATVNREDLTTLANLTIEEKISPLVSRTCSLGDAPEAMRHLETGHTLGKLVVTI
jgi:D-arabinose 1-dehydrogenase-like Zn-dependent alcohol dehydrogenase